MELQEAVTEMQGQVHESTIMAGDCNTVRQNRRVQRQKVSKDVTELSNTTTQLDVTDIKDYTARHHQNAHSPQVYLWHTPWQTTFWAKKHTLADLKD